MRAGLWGIGAALALLLVVARAHADESDEARAQTLFDEAIGLMDAGRFADACPKLEESRRLQSAGGTVLNLAYCQERTARLVLAAKTYEEAARMAEAEGRAARKTQAEQRRARLVERIPHVLVRVPPARTTEIDVDVDGARVTPEASDGALAVPLDPGEHVVAVRSRVTARAVESKVALREGEMRAIDVAESDLAAPPELRPAPPPARAMATPPATERPARGSPPPASLALGAGGIAAGIAGGVFAVLAANAHAESDRLCVNGGCSPEGIAAERRADDLAWGANIAFGASIVTLGVAAAIWILAPKAGRTIAF